MNESSQSDLPIRAYLFMGFAGLIALWLALMERYGLLALATALAGALGLATFLVPPDLNILGGAVSAKALRRPLYLMPILVLLSIVVFEFLFGYPSGRLATPLQLMDLLAATGLLAYLSAQYRLFSLGSAVVPADPRPRLDNPAGDEPEPRPARVVMPYEPAWLAGALLACVIAGQILWRFVIVEWTVVDDSEPHRLGLGRIPWRMVMLVWLTAGASFVLLGLFRILRAYRMPPGEARLVCIDTAWTETRGEQRRIGRWLAWRRRKADKKQLGT